MSTATPLLSRFTMNYMDMSYFTTRSTREAKVVSSRTRLSSPRDIPHYPGISSEARRKSACAAMLSDDARHGYGHLARGRLPAAKIGANGL